MSELENIILNDEELTIVTGGGPYIFGTNFSTYINNDGTVSVLNVTERKVLIVESKELFDKANKAGLMKLFTEHYDPEVDYPALVAELKNSI